MQKNESPLFYSNFPFKNPFISNIIEVMALIFFLLASSGLAFSQSPPSSNKLYANSQFKTETIVQGLGIPWGMVFLNSKELLVTEREGYLKKIHLSTGQKTLIKGSPQVFAQGQGGLLDIALHPNFKQNKWVYLTYSIQKNKKTSTALGRGQLHKNSLKNFKVLFVAKPFRSSNIHYGSRIAFNKKGYLFMTVGDRGQKKQAQNLKSHQGKLLKLTDQGKPAPNNPFLKKSFKRLGAKKEIWSYGHRNPQGLFIHPHTQTVYVQEHGPKGGDEINKIKKGANYGWPIITYGRSYIGFKIGEGTHKKGMEQPIKHFTPSIAPSGLLIYTGDKFPKWKGDFFSGALVLRHLNKVKFTHKKETQYKVKKETRLLTSLNLRVRNVIQGLKGNIFISVDNGQIIKISPAK